MKTKLIFLMFAITLSNSAHALEAFVGKVTTVEPTYLPGAVTFTMDTGNATCPAGRWLKWQKPDADNNKAVYSTLMTALVSGKKIRFHINDGDTNCVGQFMHLIN